MANYLTKFKTTQEYNDFLDSNECQLVNVSYIDDANEVKYFKEDISTIPLTFTLVNNRQYYGNEHLSNVFFDGSMEYARYSIDGGTTWHTINTDEATFSVKILSKMRTAGDSLMIISKMRDPKNTHIDNIIINLPDLHVSGNIMSIVYGDEFKSYNTKDVYYLDGIFENTYCNPDGLYLPKTVNSEFINADDVWNHQGVFQDMFKYFKYTTCDLQLNQTSAPFKCYMDIFKESALVDAGDIVSNIKHAYNRAFCGMFNGSTNLAVGMTFLNPIVAHEDMGECQAFENMYYRTAVDTFDDMTIILNGPCKRACAGMFAEITSTDLSNNSITFYARPYGNNHADGVPADGWEIWYNMFVNSSTLEKTPKLYNIWDCQYLITNSNALTDIYLYTPWMIHKEDVDINATLHIPAIVYYDTSEFNNATVQMEWTSGVRNVMRMYNKDSTIVQIYGVDCTKITLDDNCIHDIAMDGNTQWWLQPEFMKIRVYNNAKIDNILLDDDLSGTYTDYNITEWILTNETIDGYPVYEGFSDITIFGAYNGNGWVDFYTSYLETPENDERFTLTPVFGDTAPAWTNL